MEMHIFSQHLMQWEWVQGCSERDRAVRARCVQCGFENGVKINRFKMDFEVDSEAVYPDTLWIETDSKTDWMTKLERDQPFV